MASGKRTVAQSIFLRVTLRQTLRNSAVLQTRKKVREPCKTNPDAPVSFLLAVGMTGRFLFYETGLYCRQCRQYNPDFF